MKIFTLLILLLTFKSIASSQSNTNKDAKSKLNSVTVFLDGAEVYRTKKANLIKGTNRIEFKGLSPFINANSIRVNAKDNLDLLSISHHDDYFFNDQLKPEVKSINDSINTVNSQIIQIDNHLKAFNSEKEMLMKNQDLAKGASIQSLANAATFFRERFAEININESKLQLKGKRLKTTLKRLEQQLESIKSSGQYNRGKIVIVLKSEEIKPIEIGIKYLVDNAGWAPIYDIKASNINNPIDLVYKAKVYNETQIDWNNVVLKLSTSDPNRNVTKPSLDKWEISYANKSPIQIEHDRGYFANRKTSKIDEEVEINLMIPVDDLNSEFNISGKYDIPTSSNPYFVEVGFYKLNATYNYYCAPKIDKSAFLIAKVTGWEDINLIYGKANVYFNGTYIGQSEINNAEVSDTMDISLGRDNKIVVKRVKKKELSTKQFIGSNKKETFAYETIIKNNRNRDINIEIIDQIPVSTDSDVVVEKLESEGAIYNELEGSLIWNVNVKPQSSQKRNFSFSIKYPKNKPIRTKSYSMRSIRYF